MFSFTDYDTNIDENIEGNLYFCLKEINDYIEKYIKLIDAPLDNFTKDHLIVQINLKIKNELLAFVLVHEFNISKRAGVLDKNNELKSFVILSNTSEWKTYLFNKYSGLRNRLTKVINNIVNYIGYFCKLLVEDQKSIKDTFHLDIHNIHDIILFKGDIHKNGESVIQIKFNNKKSLYFKNRNCYNEIFFHELISFLKKEVEINITHPIILCYDNHAWMSEIEYSNNFVSEKDIEKYYENLGKIMCIFHMLGSTDIIPDNVLIGDNKPSFFDLEMLITKPFLKNINSIRGVYTESVKKIGFLPEIMVTNVELDSMVLSSVLFRINNQSIDEYEWDKKDFSYKIKERLFSDSDDLHIPKIDSKYFEITEKLLPFFINGFKEIYRYIISNKEKLKIYIEDNKDFIKVIRVLFHATSIYSQIREESLTPEYYNNREHIKEILHELVSHFYTDGYDIDINSLIESIYTQIDNFDIPFFYYDVNKGVLIDGNDNILSKWDFNPISFVSDRIEHFSEKNMEIQENIIKSTCSFAFDYMEYKEKGYYKNERHINYINEVENFDSTKLLKIACKIADIILDSALIDKNGINWISKVRETNGKYDISLMNYDLYDGLSGMCLLFIQLYDKTKDEKYKKVYISIFNELKRICQERYDNKYYQNLTNDMIKSYPISPYSFPSSFIYLLLQDINLDTNENWDIAKKTVLDIKFLVEQSEQNDYLLGVYGLIDFLISNISFFPESLLDNIYEVIEICKEKIIMNEVTDSRNLSYWNVYSEQNKAMGGFAHGSSSFSYVLSKIAISDNRFKDKIISSLNHDRSFFNKNINGWVDNREDVGVLNDPVAWCHGSSGVALGRILISNYYKDDLINDEIIIAKNNIIERGLYKNESICHGGLGNAEILYGIGIKLNDDEIKNKVLSYISWLCNNIENDLSFFENGADGKTEILGLFMGNAGFAYQLLRFYDWKNTPSVLCLETIHSLNKLLHEK